MAPVELDIEVDVVETVEMESVVGKVNVVL